jgi:hypothetical protein
VRLVCFLHIPYSALSQRNAEELVECSLLNGVESTLAGASVIADGCNDVMLRVVGRVDDGKLLGHGWDALWTGLAWFALLSAAAG